MALLDKIRLVEKQQPHLFPPNKTFVSSGTQKGRFQPPFPHPPREDSSHRSTCPEVTQQQQAASHPCRVSPASPG